MSKVTIIFLLLLGLTGLGLHGYWLKQSDNQPVYINVQQVFNGFDMKKELEADYGKVFEKRQTIIDSLKLRFNTGLAVNPENPELEKLRAEILYREQQFEEQNQLLVEKSNEEILAQLNVYMKEFGEKNRHEFIFGARGDGGLIYAKPGRDVTERMLEFVNRRYHGER